jgi:hypothetical protein
VYLEEILIDVSFHHADRGGTCLIEMPTLGHRRDTQMDVESEVVVGVLREV